MSSIKLKHSGGNSMSIAAPSSNPAADRTITLNDNYAGNGSFVTANSSGNVGIGNTDPSQARAVIQSTSGTQLALVKDNNGASISLGGVTQPRILMEANPTSSQLAIYTAGGSTYGSPSWSERVRLDSSGLFFVGTTNTAPHTDGSGVVIHPTAGVLVGVKSTHAAIFARHDSDGECVRFQRANTDVGSIDVSSSSTSYNTSSDYRLKENVVSISDGITRLKTLKPSRFNFKVDKDTTVDGFLAHEVTAVPEAITGTKDEVDSDNNPVYQGIDQSKLVPLLTAALQEEIAKREALEARVAALEAG